MKRPRFGRRSLVALVGTAVLGMATPAYGFWLATDHSNAGRARTDTLPQGATPSIVSANPTNNTSVTLRFDRVSTASGTPITAYKLYRYVSGTTTGAVEVTSPSCSFDAPSNKYSCTFTQTRGSWQYTVVPTYGSNWTGAEGPQSTTLVVDTDAPTISSLAIGPNTGATPETFGGYVGAGKPYYVYAAVTDPNTSSGIASVTATITSLTSSQTSPVALTPLASSVVINGTSYNYRSNTGALTSDASLANGTNKSFSVSASDVVGNTSANASGSVTIDTVGPTLSAVAVGPQSLTLKTVGFIPKSSKYYVYAAVNEGSGSGVGSVTATVSALTATQSAPVTLSVISPVTINGTTYNYRSASDALTTDAGLTTEGATKTVTVAAVDQVSNSSSANGTVKIDNTPPGLNALLIANGTNSTSKKLDSGDTIDFKYADTNGVAPQSLQADWDGSAQTNVTAQLTNNTTANDVLTVPGVGTVNLGTTDYVTGAAGTQNLAVTLTRVSNTAGVTTYRLTFGATPSSAGTNVNSSVFVWTPSSTTSDDAGNAISSTPPTMSSNNTRF